MKKIICLFLFTLVMGLAYASTSFGSPPAGTYTSGLTCDWLPDSPTGALIVGIDGSAMPNSFTFQINQDSTPSFCVAYEQITYDGSVSGATATANTKVIYAQVLAALMQGKQVIVCGQYAYTADGGHSCLAKAIRIISY